jgi:peroxiredoxin
MDKNFITKKLSFSYRHRQAMNKKPKGAALLKSLLVIVASVCSLVGRTQEVQPMIGQAAPPFELGTVEGKNYSLEQVRGKYLVIHFAATWCPFCNAEAPHLEQFYKDYRDKDVEVIIIDVKEEKSLVEKLVNRFKFSFPVLLDMDGKVSASYAPDGVQPALERHEVPIASNLLINKEGIIVFYSLLNTTNFDAKLMALRETLDRLIKTDK